MPLMYVPVRREWVLINRTDANFVFKFGFSYVRNSACVNEIQTHTIFLREIYIYINWFFLN